MNVKVVHHGPITVLRLQGNLMGGPDATALNTKLHELVDEGKKDIVIDLSGVEFMNSSGLGILIGGVSAIKHAGGALKLACASEKIRAVITIAKLSAILNTHPTVEAAIESFKK